MEFERIYSQRIPFVSFFIGRQPATEKAKLSRLAWLDVEGKGGRMTVAEITEHRYADEKIVEIELERLRFFANHPFKVQADSQMIELKDSIRKYGILNPLIVRPRLEEVYSFR